MGKGYFRIRIGTEGIEDQVVGSSPSAKWRKKSGPSPTPSPSPTPTPSPAPTPSPDPSEGECVFQDLQADCEGTTQGGIPCRWCYLAAIDTGICLEPDDDFDDC